MTKNNCVSLSARLIAGALCVASVAACTPLVVGGALTGAMVAVDRRSSGAQLDDQGIELRAANRLRDQLGNRARVSVTSYNRHVLLTGEAASEAAKAEAEAILRSIDSVGPIYNELAITNSPSFSEKASDGLLTGRVKTGLVEIRELSANAFKVVSERGTVYLMGRVTQKEANMATEVARTTKGALRVVRVMEILTEEELARLPLAQ
ncbi:MAG: BON domain-containing protein [Burkholderiaceae bacterium]